LLARAVDSLTAGETIREFLMGLIIFGLVGYLLLVAPHDDSIRWLRRPTPITLRGVAMAFAVLLFVYAIFAMIRT